MLQNKTECSAISISQQCEMLLECCPRHVLGQVGSVCPSATFHSRLQNLLTLYE